MLADFPQDQEGNEVDRYDVIAISILRFIKPINILTVNQFILNCLRLCFKCISKSISIIFLKVEEVSYNIVKQNPSSPFDNMIVKVIVDFKKCNIIFCLKLLEIEVILRFLKYIETLLPLSYFANILLPNILLNAYKLPMN